MIDVINPSIPIAIIANFMGLLISDCPSTSNITITLEGGIFLHEQQKSKLNIKLFIMYCSIGDIWNMAKIEIDKQFICRIAKYLSFEKDDPKPSTIEEAMCHSDWPKWNVIEKEYISLCKKHVFGLIMNNLSSPPFGYKFVSVGKCNEKGHIIYY